MQGKQRGGGGFSFCAHLSAPRVSGAQTQHALQESTVVPMNTPPQCKTRLLTTKQTASRGIPYQGLGVNRLSKARTEVFRFSRNFATVV